MELLVADVAYRTATAARSPGTSPPEGWAADHEGGPTADPEARARELGGGTIPPAVPTIEQIRRCAAHRGVRSLDVEEAG